MATEMDFEASFMANIVPTAVGRSVIAWNSITYCIFQLFEILSELDNASARGVFFVIKSDRSQRDLVGELIRTKIKPTNPKLAKRINAKFGEIDSLAAKRNDILHVIYLDQQQFFKTKVFQVVGYLKGKTGNDLVEAIHQTTMECIEVSIDLMRFQTEVYKLTHFKNKALAKLLELYISEQKSPKDPNRGEFGLLGTPAKT